MLEAAPGDELTLVEMTKRFSTEESAREYFERRMWPNGPVCRHCGNADQARIWKVTPNPAKRIRAGLYKCAECEQGFTVTIDTVMEDSHIPLNKWLIAFYMICASKTQVSVLQLQRQLEIGSYRSALFLCQRIRFALNETVSASDSKLSGVVEAEETYIRGKWRGRGRAYVGNKTPAVALVERGGRVGSTAIEKVTGAALEGLLKAHIDSAANLNTDESPVYSEVSKTFASHDTVDHSADEYSRRGEATGQHAKTNTAKGFFENSKRFLDGTHHHISRQYLPLYLTELDYKHNTRRTSNGARTAAGVKIMGGKRLMLRRPKGTT